MISEAVLSGAISAILGSIVGVGVTHLRNEVHNRVRAIRSVHAELCENKDRIEKQIEFINKSDGWKREFDHGYVLDAYQAVPHYAPDVFTTLASQYLEIVVVYRDLERLNTGYNSSTQPGASFSTNEEEMVESLKVTKDRLEQAIESTEMLWDDSWIRSRFFTSGLENPYDGIRMVRLNDALASKYLPEDEETEKWKSEQRK